jgi:ABC-type transport system involved in cytochrome bd biosynthesis fused ATPase/permease subunit
MELLCKPVSIVWAVLMLATCASTWLLTKSSVTPEVATVAIMLVAAVKVRLVMRASWRCGARPR